jgi:23S rRNA pseudouridine2605 synthase
MRCNGDDFFIFHGNWVLVEMFLQNLFPNVIFKTLKFGKKALFVNANAHFYLLGNKKNCFAYYFVSQLTDILTKSKSKAKSCYLCQPKSTGMNRRQPQDIKPERKSQPKGGRPVKSNRADKPANNLQRKKATSGRTSDEAQDNKPERKSQPKGGRPVKSNRADKPANNLQRKKATSGRTSDEAQDNKPERKSQPGSDRPVKSSRTGKAADYKQRARTTSGKTSDESRNEGARFTKKSGSFKKSGAKASKPYAGERNALTSDTIRLNKYLADAGVCSRREADELIKAGVVKVNGVTVTEMGTKVSIHDKVTYGGQTLSREKLRYVLLNKPKDFITTSDDPFNRKTVMELVAKSCTERIYPVGRLDRNTLGLLLFTNDGELAKRLMHPRHKVKKLYHVELDKNLTKQDMLKIVEGIELEDGIAEVDKIAYVQDADSKKEVGLELHSGKNRIVRRIFESLGYKVVRLDRVMYAGLTKLNLTRGHWRHLTPREVAMLKMIK